ncbi:MAG TPA: methyltransferase domain-containing protein [Abditibacteriaceae bacterium]|nr:methyltransferase domain-containing protein [Abditibacteriaceae bacterium]
MSTSASSLSLQRGRCHGVRQILRFNWHFYAAGTAACIIGAVLLQLVRLPNWLLLLGWLGIAIGVWWLLASLAVSYFVYDLSPLYRWDWLRSLLPSAPPTWANVHAGLDESSPALRAMFGGDAITVDIYDAAEMTEPSIARARRLTSPPVPAVSADYRSLPFADGELDAVFLIFAAHEIRSAESRQLFWNELHRVLRAGGVLVLVEHLRDFPNFIAFGPGCWHFLPRREWLRLFAASGFEIEREFGMTPFVRVCLLSRSTP